MLIELIDRNRLLEDVGRELRYAPTYIQEKVEQCIREAPVIEPPPNEPLPLEELRELYERAKRHQQGQAPSPSYETGRTDGFYEGVRYMFDKIAEQSKIPLTLEQLREMGGEPVYVKAIISLDEEWCIVKYDYQMKRIRFWAAGGGWYDSNGYGDRILAYRRRSEGGTV